MCGITGFFKADLMSLQEAEDVIKSMADSLIHRGPDASNTFVDSRGALFMGHRRLSILDTSKGGLQPMKSKSGNLVIAFNGEIYNHNELRAELETLSSSIKWDSTSDTETLLAAFEEWGVADTLPKLRGMFAIALWDEAAQDFYLIRDRFGEKPLYYGWIAGEDESVFSFASELKALRRYPNFSNQVSRKALVQYFSHMYVPCPLSIYSDIYKLEPGCILKISTSPPKDNVNMSPHSISNIPLTYESLSLSRWYDFKEVVNNASQNLFTDLDEASSALESELQKVIEMQSISDVPLGAFLSGGVDSSTIVALMQKHNNQPVKTFTIGFEDPDFDESPFANEVAKFLQTDHSELLVTAEDAQSMIPNIPLLYDEPFADYSQIPTYFVCKSAKQSVTVSLSGDAGDELFGGYNRYLMAPVLWKRLSYIPQLFRKIFGRLLLFLPIHFYDYLFRSYCKIFGKEPSFVMFGDKVHKFAKRLGEVNSEDSLFLHLVSEPSAEKLVIFTKDDSNIDPSMPSEKIPAFLQDPLPSHGTTDFASRMMYKDTLNYLTDDILCKVDRAAMGVSLETRVPFLDHKIVELAWRIPPSLKIRGTEGKFILRNILYKYVPKILIERPKAGFSIPLGEWLKGPLRDWANILLDKSRIEEEGYLDSQHVETIWAQHLNGERDWTFKLWSILMFQAWLDSIK